jgi:hypothetical protein
MSEYGGNESGDSTTAWADESAQESQAEPGSTGPAESGWANATRQVDDMKADGQFDWDKTSENVGQTADSEEPEAGEVGPPGDATAATGRAAHVPGQEASVPRADEQSEPDGPVR